MSKAIEEGQRNQKYDICLIITDGAITDLDATIDQIVALSDHPISIVIIGVGSADFSMMCELDADESPLYSKTFEKFASRDIVQFVEFNKFSQNPGLLAKEVLREIPGQILNYFQSKNMQPNQPVDPMLRV